MDPSAPLGLLLQGPPRIGKSTVITRLVDDLQAAGVRLGGFLTRELFVDRNRVGFAVCDVTGAEAVIAHRDFATPVSVGRYGVDVPAFERVALPALARAASPDIDVVVIDEIARMELASTAFVEALHRVLTLPVPLVATIHVHAHPVTDALLRCSDVEIISVSEANRDRLPTELLARLTGR